MKKIIAIDLGGTSVKLAIVDPSGQVMDKWSVPTRIHDEGSHIVPDIIASIQERLSAGQMTTADILGIGMGTPGTIDLAAGTVIGAYNLNWKELQPLRQQFTDAFQLPFYFDNDANVAALGEQWQGAGLNHADVVMITIGTGVGGGIVIGGHLVHGAVGAAGEIGHITIDPHLEMPCTCGKKGCLEAVASATGMINLAKMMATTDTMPSELKDRLIRGEVVTAAELFDAAKAGEGFANSVVDRVTHYLGLACSHIANMLNPEYIVLGGGVSHAGAFLLECVQMYMIDYCFSQVRNSTKLVLAQLGNDAGILGAAQLVNLNERGTKA